MAGSVADSVADFAHDFALGAVLRAGAVELSGAWELADKRADSGKNSPNKFAANSPDTARTSPQSTAQDVKILMAHSLGISRTALSALPFDYQVPPAQYRAFQTALDQRKRFQPIAQIIGCREFWGRDFKVSADVLDPRADSEVLIDYALRAFAGRAPDRVLDLGLGTGCLLLTLLCEWSLARGVGVDISPPALAVARANAEALGVLNRADLRLGDWFSAINPPIKPPIDPQEKFDIILSNPPYIAHHERADLSPDVAEWEPSVALFGGADGLSAYRIIAAQAGDYLRAGGLLLLEIGHKQAGAVADLFVENWQTPTIHQDLNGKDRLFAITRV